MHWTGSWPRTRVLSHDLVEGKILIGESGRARTRLLAAYSEIHRARTAHAEVVEFVESRRLRGRGIGWVDAHLLASTVVDRCTLWTADASLADLAAELRVAYAAAR
jgi:hypothetical protein